MKSLTSSSKPQQKIIAVVMIAGFLIVWLNHLAILPVKAAGASLISLSPNATTIKQGDEVLVSLNIASVSDLYACQITLDYPSTVLGYLAVSEGSFLNQNGSATTFTVAPLTSTGSIKMYAISRVGQVSGVSGNGTLATFRFRGLSVGTANITISTASQVGTILLDSAGAALAYTTSNTAITVTTAQAPDTTGPIISSISASSITTNSAQITWTTNEAGDSQVDYGLTTSYGQSSVLNTTLVLNHSVVLSGLSVDTTYHFRVKSKDQANNLSQSQDQTFKTQATNLSVTLTASPSSGTAPLAGVDLTATVGGNLPGNINYTFYCNRSDSGVIITLPYSVKYDNRSQTSQTATDLCSYTQAGIYTAKIIVERGTIQAENRINITVASQTVPPDQTPPDQGTPPPPLVGTLTISQIEVIAYGTTQSRISWTTSPPATCLIQYRPQGTATSQNQQGGPTALAQAHSMVLGNLQGETSYVFTLTCQTSEGVIASSQEQTFTAGVSSAPPAQPPPQPPTNGTTTITDGSLIKGADNNIYLIQNNQKRRVISLEAFNSCKYDWQAIISVTTDLLNQYAPGADFNGCPTEIILVKTAASPAVYQISKDTKRHLPSIEVFTSYGYSWGSITIISQAQLDSYPPTVLIKTDTDPNVYHFSATRVRRRIASTTIFESYGFLWDKIIIINDTEMAVYPDCRVIKTADSPDVYQLSAASKRKITSVAAFNTLGYRWEDIDVINQTEFQSYQTAEPYSIQVFNYHCGQRVEMHSYASLQWLLTR